MNIKDIRKQTGLSQAKFGELLNIPKRSIQNWELGTTTPPDYLVKLIEYYVKHEGIVEKTK